MSTEKVLRHKAICDELNKLYEKKEPRLWRQLPSDFCGRRLGHDPYSSG